jgi:hypothetical protein
VLDYNLEHTIGVGEHVIVPKPQNCISVFEKHPAAIGVVGGIGMLAAIELDDKIALAAGEIGKVGSDRQLANELVAQQLTVTQMRPKALLSVS